MPDALETPRSALAAIARPGRYGVEIDEPGVVASEICGHGLAGIAVGRAGRTALAGAVDQAFGVTLPDRPRRVEARDVAFIWAGPDQWLAQTKTAPATGMEAMLRSRLGNIAALVDQSHGRTLLRVTGPKIRHALGKGATIDLHPRVFQPGHAAMTLITHIGVHLWQLDNGPDGPVYEIAVPRSSASSFWHWLEASAAEYGLEVLASKSL